MTPKEKANELVIKYSLQLPAIDNGKRWVHATVFEYDIKLAMELAVISVDEILEFLVQASEYLAFPEQIKYWQQVKTEIELL